MEYDGLKEIYDALHRQNPGDVQGVGHRNKNTAAAQYTAVEREVGWGWTVLDVGCGYCHLWEHLEDWIEPHQYMGIDTNQDVLDNRIDKRLHVGNIDVREAAGERDLVACVGTLAWYDPKEAIEIARACVDLARRTTVFVMHADTTPFLPIDLPELLNAQYWKIDRSFDDMVTSVVIYKKAQPDD